LVSLIAAWLVALTLDPMPPAPVPKNAAPQPASMVAEADDDADDEAAGDDDEETTVADGEGEIPSSIPVDDTLRYSLDVKQEELEPRFCSNLESLGSISVGFNDAGRLINAARMPEHDAWELVVPEYAWGTAETVDSLQKAALAVRELHPTAAALRINHIGRKDGGYLRPHRSHQAGRDADLGFYYRAGVGPGGLRGNRIPYMELAQNWALLRSLITMTDVQVILVDKKVQAALYAHALTVGEDKGWLDSIFHAGSASLVQHARRHRDHFHVRFFSPRSQELGRRVQPILAKRPDENRMIHRIRSGDTLGAIARKYGSTVAMIQKANGMRNSFLKLGRTISVPMRGPCTMCPQPPPFVVPSRRMPPAQTVVTQSGGAQTNGATDAAATTNKAAVGGAAQTASVLAH
jgi:LysM repeat protein